MKEKVEETRKNPKKERMQGYKKSGKKKRRLLNKLKVIKKNN